MTSKTIALTGAEIRVDYSGGGTNVWLRNDSTAVVYASAEAGISAGADGVISIPAGQAAAVYGAAGTVYLLGTGSVQLVGSDYTACPFKVSTSASGEGGVDEVARAAITTHTGNMEIHINQEERNRWNGKAEISDIPSSLPARGGNADSLGGKAALAYTQSHFVPQEADADKQLENGYYMMPQNSANAPNQDYGFLIVAKAGDVDVNINWIMQFWYSVNLGTLYRRIILNGSFGEWKALADVSG